MSDSSGQSPEQLFLSSLSRCVVWGSQPHSVTRHPFPSCQGSCLPWPLIAESLWDLPCTHGAPLSNIKSPSGEVQIQWQGYKGLAFLPQPRTLWSNSHQDPGSGTHEAFIRMASVIWLLPLSTLLLCPYPAPIRMFPRVLSNNLPTHRSQSLNPFLGNQPKRQIM